MHSPARLTLSLRVRSTVGLLAVMVSLVPASVSAVAPSGAPTLLTPTFGQLVSANPTFSWSAVSGAVKYRVQISTSDSFGSFVYNVDTSNRKATPPADLPLGVLYWRVAATDGGSGVGPFAESSFTKEWGSAPTIDAPASIDTFDFPTEPVLFRWEPLSGAKSYTLEIDDADDFIGATSYTTTNTNFTLTEPPTTGQTFFWRLQATSSTGGVVSDWSATRQYDYTWSTVPTLIAPDNNAAIPIVDVTFEWLPVVGAKTYELQVSPNGDWANNVVLDVTVESTKYSAPTNLNNGSYFWRVRAKDAKGTPNNGGWSAEWQFQRHWPDVPTILAPAWDWTNPTDIPTIGVPTFRWTPAAHASHYELWFGTDPNFSPGSYSTCLTNHTQVTPYSRTSGLGGEPGGCTIPSGHGTVYYWKVRGIDAPAGILGLWSAQDAAHTYRFMYAAPIPVLVSPADGATVQTPTLEWQAVPNIEKYSVTIKNSSGTTVKSATTYATSYTPDTLLNPADGPFSWYVTTIDGNGAPGIIPAQGDWFHFSLTAPITTTSFNILTPANAATSVRMPKFTWEPYTGADYYRVWYGPVGGLYSATPLSGGSKLKYAGFTSTGLPLPAGSYKYYVEAFNAADLSLATSVEQTFEIIPPDTLSALDYLTPAKCTFVATCQTEADTPTISWNSVPDAGAYEVTLASDPNFTNEIKRYVTIFTTITPRESLLDSQAGQATYWFVRPCVDKALSRCGPSAQTTANQNASAFRKASAPVELDSPLDGTQFKDQTTFSWSDYLDTNLGSPWFVNQEARQYKVEVSLAADFSSIFDTITVDQTSYTAFSKTYPEGPLYWRVQAIDGSGNPLTLSSPRLVTKQSDPLTPTFPGDGSTQPGVPYFAWTPQAFAATYTIEVYKNGDTNFSPSNKVLTQTTKFSAWSPTTSLAAGVYAWRVRRADADGRAGPWSAARTFTLGPAATTLISPTNGATVDPTNFAFTWTGVAGAVQYRIEVAPTCTFSTSTDAQTTVMTSWAPTLKYANGSYCWRVKSLDASANVLSTSDTRTFGVGSAPPPPAAPSTYVPLSPVRLLDTRTNNGLSGQFVSGTARTVEITGRGGVPANAVGVTGNVTVTGQTAGGYVSVTPEPTNNPSTSTINFPKTDVRANNVTTSLGTGGKLSFVYKSTTGAKTHIVFDVTGYFVADNSGATYKTVAPVRLLDTRTDNGLSGKFISGTPRTWPISGRGGVPANALAVTGNLTVTGQTSGGYVSLGPDATSTPTTSTLNFPVADVRANGITVKLDPSGNLSAVFKGSTGAKTDLVFDVTGYYLPDLTGARFVPMTPVRRLDTRTSTGLVGKFTSGTARTLALGGAGGIPVDALGVTGNLTVVNQTSGGYVSMTQETTSSPTTSTINFPVGDVRANGVTGPLTPAGTVGLVFKGSTGAKTDLVLDISGYFAP